MKNLSYRIIMVKRNLYMERILRLVDLDVIKIITGIRR